VTGPVAINQCSVTIVIINNMTSHAGAASVLTLIHGWQCDGNDILVLAINAEWYNIVTASP